MTSFSLKADETVISKIIQSFDASQIESGNSSFRCRIKADDCNITIYHTKTVLFQGKNAETYYSAFTEKKEIILPQAGSDEVGNGSYFGPLTVCACYLDETNYKEIAHLKIIDSKQLTDPDILKIAPVLIQKVPHSLLILDNKKYNEVSQKNNLNKIKALMHNQCYINLQKKGITLPSLTVIDDFCGESLYYRYIADQPNIVKGITFTTKAENKYPSVAAGAIISRYAFLKSLETMSQQYQITIPSGAGNNVDQLGVEFVKKYGFDKLKEVAKLNFKNTEKIQALLKK